jgi:hypothetical protein
MMMPGAAIDPTTGYNQRVRFFRIKAFASAVLCVLFASATIHAESVTELALPDAPTPQNTTASAPQTTDAPAPLSDAEKKKLEREQAAKDLEIEEHQKVLWVVPSYNVYNGQNPVPLSPKQKFHLALRGSVNPFVLLTVGAISGYSQAVDNFPEYGQGMEGYAKRYGANFADSFDGYMFGNAIFTSILHQDPRYFRKGTGKTWKRMEYAIVYGTVFCRGDNGKRQVNYSNIMGNFAAGGISNLYYPAADRGFSLTVERALVVTAEGALGSMFSEFIPDLQDHFFGKHKSSTAAPTSPASSAPAPEQPTKP